LDLLNNNGTGKADTGSDHCSRYSLFGKAERKITYRYRELTLIPVSLPKYFTLVGTNFIESALATEDWRSPDSIGSYELK
jgi:hypothetical protein